MPKCIFALSKDTVFTLTRYSVFGKMTRKSGVMMKRIETVLSEQSFLNRLEGLCRDKVRFDRGYEDKDTFVIKRKDHKFMLAKHYAIRGKPTVIRMIACIVGTIRTKKDMFPLTTALGK